MGHRLSKSLTTILYVCPLRTDISSIPITLGRALGATKLFLHILFVQFLDRLPIKPKLFGNIADGRAPAAFPDIHRKALGVEWIVRQKVKTLLLHPVATPALDTAYLQFQKYTSIATRRGPEHGAFYDHKNSSSLLHRLDKLFFWAALPV